MGVKSVHIRISIVDAAFAALRAGPLTPGQLARRIGCRANSVVLALRARPDLFVRVSPAHSFVKPSVWGRKETNGSSTPTC